LDRPSRPKRRICFFAANWRYIESTVFNHGGQTPQPNQLVYADKGLRMKGCAVCSTAEDDEPMGEGVAVLSQGMLGELHHKYLLVPNGS